VNNIYKSGGREMKKQEAIELLSELLQETLRLYEANGKQAYDSGVYNGVKWAIEKISEGWK